MCIGISTPPQTSEFPIVSCDNAQNNGFQCNIGTCDERNSECREVQDADFIHCGCVYCNYDRDQDKCVGLCENREMSKCVPRVDKPQDDGDCGCDSCTTNYDEKGNAICSGDCLGGPYECKPKLMHIHPLQLQNYRCVCQDPSVPNPEPNKCVKNQNVLFLNQN